MSVQQNHYVMIGHKFGYDEFYDTAAAFHKCKQDDVFEHLEEKHHDSAFKGIHHHNDICILSDGYNGNYVYVGYVLKKSDNYGDIDDYVNPVSQTPEYVSNKINEILGMENVKCEYLAFTHYR